MTTAYWFLVGNVVYRGYIVTLWSLESEHRLAKQSSAGVSKNEGPFHNKSFSILVYWASCSGPEFMTRFSIVVETCWHRSAAPYINGQLRVSALQHGMPTASSVRLSMVQRHDQSAMIHTAKSNESA